MVAARAACPRGARVRLLLQCGCELRVCGRAAWISCFFCMFPRLHFCTKCYNDRVHGPSQRQGRRRPLPRQCQRAALALHFNIFQQCLQCYDVGWRLNLKQVCARTYERVSCRGYPSIPCAVNGAEGVDMVASILPVDFTRRGRWPGLDFRE